MSPNRPAIKSFAFLILLAATSPSFAGDWPQFRGPNGSGSGDGDPPTEWNVESGKNIKWKVPIPGLAHSSPIISGNHIYLTTAVSAKNPSPKAETGWLGGTGDSADDSGEWTWKVLCLDKKDGRIIWTQDAYTGVPKIKRHTKATHANGSPATDGKHVAAFFGSEGLYCYDTSGKLLWKKDFGVLKCGPYNAPDLEWGSATSPIIHDGKVIIQCDALNTGFWASFDADTGRELRRVSREDVTTWCTPSILKSGEKTLLICNGYNQMCGYDLASGEELWTLSGGGDCPVPTPQIAGNTIYLTNGHGRSPIYAIRADARGDLTPKDDEEKLPKGLAWHKPIGGSYMPTPIVLDSKLYVASDNGIISALNAKDGSEIFKQRLENAGTFSASVVAAGGRLYFVNEDGEMFVLQTGDKFKLLAKNSMNEICMATPAISDGQLFIRGQNHLFCIGK